MYRKPGRRTAHILNAATASEEIAIWSYMVAGMNLPAAFSGAAVTFKGSHASLANGGVYNTIYDADGNAITITVAANRAVSLTGAQADAVAAWPWIQLVSSSPEGGDRVIEMVLK